MTSMKLVTRILLYGRLELGEVEAVFTSPFVFRNHQVYEVEYGSCSLQLGPYYTIEKYGQYVF